MMDMDITEIWDRTIVSVKNNINSPISYNVHIKVTKPVSLINSVFTISVPTSINKNIIETTILKLITKYLSIILPKNTPSNGITKWYIPTIIDKIILFFLLILCVPYIRAKEKASILRLIPIIKVVKKVFNIIHLINNIK